MKNLKQIIMIKGIALVSTLAGLQQWLSLGISPFDIFFIMLVAMFLISVEHDYFKFKKRTSSQKPDESIFFEARTSFTYTLISLL